MLHSTHSCKSGCSEGAFSRPALEFWSRSLKKVWLFQPGLLPCTASGSVEVHKWPVVAPPVESCPARLLSTASDDGEDGQLVTLDRYLVQGALAGVDHGYADLFRVNALEKNNVAHRSVGGELLFLLFETVVPEKGKQLDRNRYPVFSSH